jgi:hypothetical protein
MLPGIGSVCLFSRPQQKKKEKKKKKGAGKILASAQSSSGHVDAVSPCSKRGRWRGGVAGGLGVPDSLVSLLYPVTPGCPRSVPSLLGWPPLPPPPRCPRTLWCALCWVEGTVVTSGERGSPERSQIALSVPRAEVTLCGEGHLFITLPHISSPTFSPPI